MDLTNVPMAVWIYVTAMIGSRFAFRHRECVTAAPEGSLPESPWRGAILCLLPLGLMQLGPFVEYILRYRAAVEAGVPAHLAKALPATMYAGTLVFFAGTVLAAVASRHLAESWSEDSDALCTGGLYAIIRHPMYAGYLIQGAGCGLMMGAVWAWALYGLAAGLILLRVFAEDRDLARRAPAAFQAYSARVRRLLPFVF